MAVTVCVLLEG